MPSKSAGVLAAFAILAVTGVLAGCARDVDAPPTEERAFTPPEARFTAVSEAMLSRADGAANDWPAFGGTYANQRFSTLNQINRTNVADLVPAWVFQTGVPGSFSATPVVAGNVMYVTTPESGVIALNAATGDELWRFEPELGTRVLCCGPENHGVGAWGTRVFVGTLDARLIALDSRTGEVDWEVDVANPEDGYSITMAPLAFQDRVFIGVSGGAFGIRGHVDAYDAESGDLVWRWYTIPEPGDAEAPNGWWGEWREFGPFGELLDRDIERERSDSARWSDAWRRGGGEVRMTPAYDPENRTLYFSVGHPAPSLNGLMRPGDNLFTSSIVALDADEGALRWYLQYVPHNRWDLDAPSPPFLFRQAGRSFVGHATKSGWLYVLDAATGEPVLRSENFVPQQNMFLTPGDEGVRTAPGADGGAGWSPVAYSPRTGLAYVLALHQPMLLTREFQPFQRGRLWTGGSFIYAPDEEQYGLLTALDLTSGDIQWQHRVPVPMLGAPLATAGDVLFVGQGHGTFDALDAETGQLLWQFNAGAGVHGGPVTYAIDGIQYVAVAAGGNYHLGTTSGSSIVAFALPSERRVGQPALAYDRLQYPREPPLRFAEVRQTEPPREETEEAEGEGETSEADGEG